MIYIVKVSPTVGKSEMVAVITNKEKNIHTPLNVWVEDNFGQFSTLEYIEQFAVADCNVQVQPPVTRILCLDELLDYKNILKNSLQKHLQ